MRGSAHRREQKVAKMLPWSCISSGSGAKTLENAPVELQAPFIRLLRGGLHIGGSKNGPKCSRGHVFQEVREQKRSKMLPWSCKHPLYAFCEGVCTGAGAKSGKNAPEVMFFKGVGSKNGPKCARGFASTLYTPSVRGSAQAREQKVAKMLPWSCFSRGSATKRA